MDEYIELGGPENGAEMKGWKGRVVHDSFQYEWRLEEKISSRFMEGEKDVASPGVSLQSDRRKKNKESRVHIPVELPLAIQQGHIGAIREALPKTYF